jgi:hypothetical protein
LVGLPHRDIVYIIILFGGMVFGTQGFMLAKQALAKQALYNSSYTSSPHTIFIIMFSIFEKTTKFQTTFRSPNEST